jgi:hypothetical protein
MRVWIVVALIFSSSALWAQTSGSISGKITDKTTKQPLEDAVVVLRVVRWVPRRMRGVVSY